jgi:hypothetical protein
LDHESLGAAMLNTAGSDAITISMVNGKCDAQIFQLLEQADDIYKKATLLGCSRE